ncbi:MAG: ATP-binding protein, partial [Gammaproteobacteria bacterium]
LFEVYVPRQVCMRHDADVVWLHVAADSLIAIAYFSIPMALIYFVRRREDLAFNWIFLLFAAFITACGITHVIGVVDIWAPAYRFEGVVKLATGVISAATAILLWRLIPGALTLPSLAGLRSANTLLGQEIAERRRAEERLQGLRDALETRVMERTAQLERVNVDRDRLLVRERALRAEAEQANQLKDEFVGTLSHELRTPMTAIVGWITLLRRSSAPADVERGLEVIARNVRTQQRMIDDLLDINRIAAGKVVLEIQPVDLVAVVEMALESLRPAAGAKNMAITASYDAGPARAQADPGRLQQAVSNLLSNAIKFTPDGGRVNVSVRRDTAGWQITVEDNGRGISAAFLPHVFERFRQGDASLSRSAGGLGLGLAIVKSLVELHGGTVVAQSDGEGRGARFTIHLPQGVAHEPAEPESRAPGPARHPMTLDAARVLLVDDEADVREMLRRVLEKAGATVTLAGSATEALQALDRSPPDIIISDIGLPGEDGYSLLRRVRARNSTDGGKTPALAVTAFARGEDRQRAILAGYQGHIAKPVEPDDLIAAVVQVLSGRELQ